MQQTYLELRNTFSLRTDEAKKAFDEARRSAFESLGDDLLTTVRSSIYSSRLNDENETVRRWQDVRRGSLGGYAVVEVKADGRVGADSPGAITNYLEHGHVVRSRLSGAKRYTPKVRKYKTTAYGFYADSKAPAQRLLDAAGEKVAEAVAKALEDG